MNHRYHNPIADNTPPPAHKQTQRTGQFLDDTMRIVRVRGPKFEGRLNIFVRRRIVDSDSDSDSDDDDSDDDDSDGNNAEVDGAQANTERPGPGAPA